MLSPDQEELQSTQVEIGIKRSFVGVKSIASIWQLTIAFECFPALEIHWFIPSQVYTFKSEAWAEIS